VTEQVRVREIVTVQADGRMTIPDVIRKAVDIHEQKAFCEVSVYGKDKILLTIMSRWKPPISKKPVRDVTKK
jgi:bifunctional DNA-binding transcriptional regulator/antitoxin component of YhaV-PrlF toxin-antitoxin module